MLPRLILFFLPPGVSTRIHAPPTSPTDVIECQKVNVGSEIRVQPIPRGRFLAMTHSAKLNFLTNVVAVAETVPPSTKANPRGLRPGPKPGSSTTKICRAALGVRHSSES